MSYTVTNPVSIIVAGPAGTGKTTVGEDLANRLNAPYVEGDSLHPPENVKKMGNGIPLTDDDRWGWLEDVAKTVSKGTTVEGKSKASVGTCSALTKVYREYLKNHVTNSKFIVVFLWAEKDELYRRVSNRKGHYMGANMVDSQFNLMQVPETDEVYSMPILTNKEPKELVDEIIIKLEAQGVIKSV